jgi:hypothetical protein
LDRDALLQQPDVRLLRLEGHDLLTAAYPPERCRATESKISVISTDIDNSSDTRYHSVQPSVEFVFVKAKNFAQRITPVDNDYSVTKRTPKNPGGQRMLRKSPFQETESHLTTLFVLAALDKAEQA